MTLEYMSACPYCGQLVAIESSTEMDADELACEAGKRCVCDGAARARKIADCNERIDMACGLDSVENGFDYPLSAETILTLKMLAERIVDGTLCNAQVKDASGDDVRMKKGILAVTIERTQKKQIKL